MTMTSIPPDQGLPVDPMHIPPTQGLEPDNAPEPIPATIASISPNTAPAGGPDITLTITGTGLVAGSTVYFGAAFSPLVYGSDTEGTAEFAAAGYAVPGTIPVSVHVPGVTPSNSVDFIAT